MSESAQDVLRPLLGGLALLVSLGCVSWFVYSEQHKAAEAERAAQVAAAQESAQRLQLAHSSKSMASPGAAAFYSEEDAVEFERKDLKVPDVRDPAALALGLKWLPMISGRELDVEKLRTVRAWALVQTPGSMPKGFVQPVAFSSKSMAPQPGDPKAWVAHCKAVAKDAEALLDEHRAAYLPRAEIIAGGMGMDIRRSTTDRLRQLESLIKKQLELSKKPMAYSSKSFVPLPDKEGPAILKAIQAELLRRAEGAGK